MNAPLRFVHAGSASSLSAQACVELLRSVGFQAELRSVDLASQTQITVAVYLTAGDARVRWTDQPDRTPKGFAYRREGRGGADFTIFSGLDAGDAGRFATRLLCLDEGLSSQFYTLGGGEWDPHRLSDAELASIDRHMEEVERMAQRSPSRHRRRY
jgi:hypothetical protein